LIIRAYESLLRSVSPVVPNYSLAGQVFENSFFQATTNIFMLENIGRLHSFRKIFTAPATAINYLLNIRINDTLAQNKYRSQTC
jgi:hypothetical protein